MIEFRDQMNPRQILFVTVYLWPNQTKQLHNHIGNMMLNLINSTSNSLCDW